MCKKFEVQNITTTAIINDKDDVDDGRDVDEHTSDVLQDMSSQDIHAAVGDDEHHDDDGDDDEYDDFFIELKDNDDDNDDLIHVGQKNQDRLVELPTILLEFPRNQNPRRNTRRRKRQGSYRHLLEPQHPKDYFNYIRRKELLLDDQSGVTMAMAKLLPLLQNMELP